MTFFLVCGFLFLVFTTTEARDGLINSLAISFYDYYLYDLPWQFITIVYCPVMLFPTHVRSHIRVRGAIILHPGQDASPFLFGMSGSPLCWPQGTTLGPQRLSGLSANCWPLWHAVARVAWHGTWHLPWQFVTVQLYYLPYMSGRMYL